MSKLFTSISLVLVMSFMLHDTEAELVSIVMSRDRFWLLGGESGQNILPIEVPYNTSSTPILDYLFLYQDEQ